MIAIRSASSTDLASIQDIYAHHVTHGSASFELTPPSLAEMQARFEAITGAGFPYLVAELEGAVVGYAYANAYRARPAYRFSVEDSIYVRTGIVGKGIGKALLSALIDQCTKKGFRLMVAVIGDSQNAASISLHARSGFRLAGVLPAVGFKHGRWVDSVMMTRPLGEGDRTPPNELRLGNNA
jgi:L-amino acid N-acyltransferase YncA